MLQALFIKRLMPELNCGLKTSKQLIIFIFVTLYRTTQFLFPSHLSQACCSTQIHDSLPLHGAAFAF